MTTENGGEISVVHAWAGHCNLSVGAVALAILYATLRDLPTLPGAAKRKIHEFDYIGTVLWMGGSEHP
ncbi:hypothetical protein LPJ74_000079 [Coemansia sp. RSA 1843]|nr:hypothetical protein LPJ74_000079 [Coemansia sp. RSA 1843]